MIIVGLEENIPGLGRAGDNVVALRDRKPAAGDFVVLDTEGGGLLIAPWETGLRWEATVIMLTA